MNRTALVFPVLAAKTEADITLIADRFNADPKGYFESRRRAGVTLERAYWQRLRRCTGSISPTSQRAHRRRP